MHHFAYRDGVLHAEAVNLAELADIVGTPFYCYASATIERHYQVFAGAFADVDALLGWLGTTRNDLQPPAIAAAPVIADVLQALEGQGARLARMSGSGATCFGIFADPGAADRAAAALARNGWWAVATELASAQAHG